MTIEAFDRVHLDGTGIDRITEDEVVAVVRESLARGRGGRIITPNVDILRRASADPTVRRHLDDADLIVADGMPLIWASRLGGAPLPERVAGSSLIWSLSEGLGRDGRSIFVIGGAPALTRRKPGPANTGTLAAAKVAEPGTAPGAVGPGAAARIAGAGAAAGAVGAGAAAGIAGVEAVARAAGAGAAVEAVGSGGAAGVAGGRTAARVVGTGAATGTSEGRIAARAVGARTAVGATGAGTGVAVAAAAKKAARGKAPAKRITAEAAAKKVAVEAARRAAQRGAAKKVGDGAARAAARLVAKCPGLKIAGTLSPDFGFEEDEATYAEFCARVVAARPDMVFVGLGFPKQELVIERLRPQLPETWFVGCGAAVNFVAGDVERAPRWMQRTGLEWAHRLGVEPRRLASRYLRHDAPYALRLLAGAPRRRALRP